MDHRVIDLCLSVRMYRAAKHVDCLTVRTTSDCGKIALIQPAQNFGTEPRAVHLLEK